jgi:electron transport complex protein RnfA
MEYFLIIISAIFVNNIVLAQFLGICPFLGVSGKLSTATGMSMAVCFVITLATLVTYLINKYLLVPFNITFLQTIAFILVIAALVPFVELFMKKSMPSLYSAVGIYLPLITTNCAVLAVTIMNVENHYNLFESVCNGVFGALGFMLAIVLMAGVRERLETSDIPKSFKGFPSSLITAGLMSIAFMGFQGLVK